MFSQSSFLIVWVFFLVPNVQAAGKISCFYNSSARYREGWFMKFTHEDLLEAVPLCTHLVYMFAGIDEYTYEAKSLDPYLDTEPGWNYFGETVKYKQHNPSIKMLLSIGGFQYTKEHPYFKVLETNESRAIFIKSLVSLVAQNHFDGADLAWPFPTDEEEKTESTHDTSVGFSKEHRTMFGYLVQELSTEFKRHKLLLTLTVLPNVKADECIDCNTVRDCVEHIHLMTYDYKTPFRNPHEADYTAPLYYVKNRTENRNVEQTVDWWIKQNVPAQKLLIAIPTFGQGWRIRKGWKVKPPLKADGADSGYAPFFPEGILPYYDVCDSKANARRGSDWMKKVTDNEHHLGTYGFWREDDKCEGLWVSFEEPKTAAEKAKFANKLRLGGVAIVDLTLDDFFPYCHRSRTTHDCRYCKFPILRAAKDGLAD